MEIATDNTEAEGARMKTLSSRMTTKVAKWLFLRIMLFSAILLKLTCNFSKTRTWMSAEDATQRQENLHRSLGVANHYTASRDSANGSTFLHLEKEATASTENYLGGTPRGSCNNALLRKVLRRFFKGSGS